VTIDPTAGNAVTFATPMNYHGTTTIGQGAALLLGTGHAGGDSSLLIGASNDRIIDDGALTVRNATTPVTLQNITGSGSFTQAGAATATLVGTTAFTGPTTISAGTLALGRGSSGLGASSAVTLTSPGTVLDLSRSGDQAIRQLSGVAGSTLMIGASTLTVATAGATIFAGAIVGTGAGVTTAGAGTLTLTGRAQTPGGTWHLNQGTLALGNGAALHLGSLIEAPGATLSLSAVAGAAANAPLQAGGTVRLDGSLKISAAPLLAAGQKLTLIHDTGSSAVSGTFTGLPQGARVTVDGRVYEIDYSADGGHDVVLTAPAVASAASASSAGSGAAGAAAHHAAPDEHARALTTTLAAFAAPAAGLLAGAALLCVLVARRRRGRRLPGRRSTAHRTAPSRSRHASRKRPRPSGTEFDTAPATEPTPALPGINDDTIFIFRVE
jgi:autotransporter-associated beta strand protein